MTKLPSFSAALSDDPSILGAIANDAHHLVVWQRPLPLDLASDPAIDAGNIRILVSPDEVESHFRDALADAGYPDDDQSELLVRDVVSLATRFAGIVSAEKLRIRLDRVSTDSCRKFHADYVAARLITTYCGAATQWITTPDVARVRDGREPATIHSLSAGDVGIFKGRLAVDDLRVLHRSPPIDGTGQTRVLLVIDPADACDCCE